MNRNSWDAIYRTYRSDQIPWHSAQPDRYLVRLVNDGTIRKGRVLDLCSGDGTNSIYLASKGFEVFGIDISPTAVRLARDRCARRGVRCDYAVGDVLKLETGDKFDFAFDRGCFHHIPKRDKPRYMNLVWDFLRPSGQFYLLCFSDKNPPFEKNLSREDIRGYFSEKFSIHFIKDSAHREPGSGNIRYLYACFMTKKG